MVEQAGRLLRLRRAGLLSGMVTGRPRLVVGLGTQVVGRADASGDSIDIAEGGQIVVVCSAATAVRRTRTGRRRAAAGRWERGDGDG